jgi:serine/threonine-protein kinase
VFNGTIRILDFGTAKSTGRRFTFIGLTPAMGPPEYMAPEQVKERRGNERTDIYSLGALLYEMVSGAIPFASENEDVFVTMNARVTGNPVAPRKKKPRAVVTGRGDRPARHGTGPQEKVPD